MQQANEASSDIDSSDYCHEHVYERIIRSICFDLVASIHREVKTTNSFAVLASGSAIKKRKIDSLENKSYPPGCDIYGNVPNSNEVSSKCLSCGRSMAVTTFARHLDKCLGIGSGSRNTTSTTSISNINK